VQQLTHSDKSSVNEFHSKCAQAPPIKDVHRDREREREREREGGLNADEQTMGKGFNGMWTGCPRVRS